MTRHRAAVFGAGAVQGSATAPPAPTLTTIQPGNGSVALTWTAPVNSGGSPITSYVLTRGTSSGGETSHITGISSTALSYTDTTSVTNGTQYWYELKAVNAIGTSAASNEMSTTPMASGSGVVIAQQTTTGGPPTARGQAGHVYHPTTQLTYYFGGNGPPSGAPFSDTWSFNPATNAWTHITSATAPAEVAVVLGYDPIGEQIIWFGGDDESTFINSTASFDPTQSSPDWNLLSPATNPGIRSGACLFNDPVTGDLMLYGGNTGTPTYYDDLWKWNGTNWVLVTSALTGTGRQRPVVQTYGSETLIFGGGNSNVLNDTWLWNGTTCTQQHPATVPTARMWAQSGVTSDGRVLMYGGCNRASTVNLSDCWTWDGTNWTQQTPTGSSIGGLSSGAMDYHPPTGKLICAFGSQGPSANPPTDIATVYDFTTGTTFPVAPAAPTLTAATPGTTSVALQWTAGSNGGSALTSYTILRGTSSGAETVLQTGVSPSALSFTDNTPTPGTTYYYKVEAVNAIGTSPASNEIGATPNSAPTTLIQGIYSYSPTSLSHTQSLASTLQMTLSGYSDFTDGTSWGSIASYSPPSLPAGVTLLLSPDLTPDSTGLSAVSSNIATFQTLARTLIGIPTILRLGCEFDGSWKPWGTGANGNTASQFNPAVTLVIQAMKAINPALKFDFCCNTGTSTLSQLQVYYGSNGDSLWDFIGGDHYDTSSGPSDTFSAFGAAVNLAVQRGKPVSCGEWGLNGHDDPTFINDAAQFLTNPSAAATRYGWPLYTVGYWSYFNADISVNSDITQFPNSITAFRADFP